MNKKYSLTLILLMAAALLYASQPEARPNVAAPVKHDFPALPYAYNALEPYIDAATMELHYSKHHRGYYDNFMKAIAGTEMETLSLEELFAQVSKLPVAVRNMGGGYYNHVLFWENLSPKPGEPSALLKAAVEKRFGSWDEFKAAFNKAALSVFGSGWAWLVVADGKLEITATPNQDNPLMDVAVLKGQPLLAIDVWEHAYYLKYQNRRAEYIEAFWKVINWNEVNRRYQSLNEVK
jgi:Fe-Mn family superoxide dismutase